MLLMDELYYVPFVQTCFLICIHVQFFFLGVMVT